MQQYIDNIHTMEQLTRTQTNLALLKKHQAQVRASKKWVPNMVPIQLVWMEPEDGWLAQRLKGRLDPIRLARMVKQIVLSLAAECSGSPSARGGWGPNHRLDTL